MDGWTGSLCTDRNYTDSASDPACPAGSGSSGCRNGGTCFNATCCCADGYEGDLCQNEVDECASSPCGSGTCIDIVNGFWCFCPDGNFPLKLYI